MGLDYSGQNLRGRSFKGQNLIGANFRGADIRGANFTNANLKNADFRGAKAGLQNYRIICWIGFSFILAFLSLFASAATNGSTWWMLHNETKEDSFILALIFALVIMGLLVVFVSMIIWKSLISSLGVISFTLSILILPSAISSTLSLNEYHVLRSWTYALTFAFIVVVVVSGIVALTLVLTKTLAKDLTVIVLFSSLSGGMIGALSRVLIRGGYKFISSEPILSWNWACLDLIWACSWSWILVLLGSYIGWLFWIEDKRVPSIRKYIIAISAIGGTSFYNADLTNTDFTGATLKNTNFRKANLTRTRFYEAKNIDFARLGDTILAKRNVLNLLVTGNGRNKSYIGAKLKGANLMDADLKEANLKHADITEATFQRANLQWANLTFTQAVGTDFTSTLMTGACVEAWNIDSTTKLNNVDCRFIYLLENPKPETDDRERRPSSGEFQPGEFTKLFEEVLNTVDLIFRNGIDWKAFVAAFKQVQVENEDTELAIQSIENKGDGVVVVKVAVPVDADKEKIHRDFTDNYQLALQAVEEKYKLLLQAKDDEILFHRQQSAKIPEIISSLANKPINIQLDNKLENKNMSNDSSHKIEIGSIGGDFTASGQALNLGDISGTVTNTINQLPESPEPEKPEIKELLAELQTAIEAESNLSPEDKAEALEQVKTLAEAAKNPQETTQQKSAKTAIKILKGTIIALPTTATLLDACSKLLPLISKFLGLG
ncbi:MAG: pentapeptide repeat-containing protein [Nostocaceae cyanobacterium]|nr:pentapeptide repeat-containing protein [Nostocaceae cyanobacterium]